MTDPDATTSPVSGTHPAVDQALTRSGQPIQPLSSANVHKATGADIVHVEIHGPPALKDPAAFRNVAEAYAMSDNTAEIKPALPQTEGKKTPDAAGFTVDVVCFNKQSPTDQERQPLGARREQERHVGFHLGFAFFLVFTCLIAPLRTVAYLQRRVRESAVHFDKIPTSSTSSGHGPFPVINFQEGSENNTSKGVVDNGLVHAGIRNDTTSWPSMTQCGVSCMQVISLLANRVEQTHDPCLNLYDHVCSRWQVKYANITAERGCYSVDDFILDKYRDKLKRRLADNHFFKNCIRGTAAAEGEIDEILEYLSVDTSLNSPEHLAETIARLARIGVSPFFDVSLTMTKEAFYVTLLRPAPLKIRQCRGSDWGSRTTSNRETELKQGSLRPGEHEFLKALRRHLCVIASQSSGLNVSCFLTSDSVITPSWNHEWYSSVGLTTLASNAASLFWPFLYSTKNGNSRSVESASNVHLPVATNNSQAEDCLAFLERYDSALLTSAGVTALGTDFEKGAKNSLYALKGLLNHKIYGVNNSSSQLRIILGTEEGRSSGNHYSNIFSDDALFNGSTLEKHLMDSTWKRWRGKARTAFSTTATFLNDSFTVEVPPPLFDAAGPFEGNWPGPLILARIGPRVIKPVLSSNLLNKLSETDSLRYVLNAPNETSIEGGVGLDIEELVSFGYSLEAYRAWTNGQIVVPGTRISSDALFLLYYAFNNCEALSPVAVSGAAEGTPKSPRRHRVESVAAVFGRALLGRVCRA